MGQRTVKRVPLDFDHPLNEVWPGYLSPTPRPCPAGDRCFNGETVDGAWLGSVATIITCLGGDGTEHSHRKSAGIHPHPYVADLPGAPRSPRPVSRQWTGQGDNYVQRPGSVPPTEAFSRLTEGLCGRAPRVTGHDAIDRWSIKKGLVEAAGLDPESFGICPECEGHGHHPDDTFDDWEETPPPEGDGWQLWETTSRGSPVSPVFESAEDLATWCGDNATWFASEKMGREQWLHMFVKGTTDIDTMLVVSVPRDSGDGATEADGG